MKNFMILMLVFSLSTLFIPSVYVNAQDNWVQISCFTENILSLDYLGLNFIVHENNSIILVGSTQFEAIGSQPILRIEIDSSGRTPSTPFGIVTSGVAFFIVNGSRDYYVIGYYYESFQVNATVENGIVDYEIDFTNNVEKAKNAIPPEGTIEDFGIRGTMTFEVMIDNSVSVIKQKRFFSVLLQAHADLHSITCDVTLPQTADIKDAKKGEQDMRKITSYRVDTSVEVTPFRPPEANLYLEWEMPEEVPWPIKYPYNIFITIVISLVVGWIGRYIYDRMISRKKSKSNNQKEKDGMAKRKWILLISGILIAIVAVCLL